MVGRKKKTKICDIGSEEEWISKLPDDLISEILVHLPTKDAVRTSLLSTRWRNLWQLVPGLDLDSDAFSNNIDALVCFADKFFDSHKESWIRRLRLRYDPNCKASLTQWINAVTIEHLDLYNNPIPLSLYTCVTLVHLRLWSTILDNPEFVSLPCLKIMHLHFVIAPHEGSLEKLISGSPVLEDLAITGLNSPIPAKVTTIQVHSHTIKKIVIASFLQQVVIDAPLLRHFKAETFATKNFKIINMGFSTKLELHVTFLQDSKTLVHGILDDISRVRDLVIRNSIWEDVFLHSEMRQLSRGFSSLYRLDATFLKSDLEYLPTILVSCPKLKSLILQVVNEPFMRHKKNREPNVIMFPTVPECLVSSLKFVGLKRSISGYDGEMGLIRYFLKNSVLLEKLRLDLYHTKKAKCDFLKELVAMPRCSTACEVRVL